MAPDSEPKGHGDKERGQAQLPGGKEGGLGRLQAGPLRPTGAEGAGWAGLESG